MPTLDELLVKIDASTELLRRELNKGDKSVTKFQRNVDRKLGRVDKRFAKLGAGIRTALGAFGIGVGVAGIASFTRSVTNAGLEMERYERALKFAAGSQEAAEREMTFLRDTADRLGLDLRALISSYSSLSASAKGTNLQGQATRDIFLGISEAATVLGLSAEQTEGALRAIDQMISKGNVQAEELRGQLGERLPGAFQIAARAMGVTTVELNKMLELGEVAADDLLPKLAVELHKTFGPEVSSATDSATAAVNRMNTAIFDLKVSIAESGILDFFAGLAEATSRAINPSLELQLARVQAELHSLHQLRDANPGEDFALDQRIAKAEADTDRLIEAIRNRDAKLMDLEAPAAPAASSRFPITDLPESKGFLGAPVTVRLGGESSGQAPVELEDVQRVNAALRDLEAQALRSQERMQEAIRSAAAVQIAEWERVKEETPQFAEQADQAIRFIKQSTEAEIAALDDATLAAKQFADTFAAAFESRGIDALLNGDISNALRGMAQDIAELILRLTVLRPLAEGFASFLGGGGFLGGLFGGVFGSSIPGRSSGGPVEANKPYLVHQDELFVPDVPGRILSAAQIARMSGGGVVVNQTNNTQAGLPPQWQAMQAMASRIAAVAARDAVIKELGGVR